MAKAASLHRNRPAADRRPRSQSHSKLSKPVAASAPPKASTSSKPSPPSEEVDDESGESEDSEDEAEGSEHDDEESSNADEGPEGEGNADAWDEKNDVQIVSDKSFADLGVSPELCASCESLGFKRPTPIQVAAIPPALEGRDIIGLAETGSGKTAAFSLPILQTLWDNPAPFYALILAPTRELAVQIAEQIGALGAPIGVKTATLVGGMDMMSQSMALARRPHIIVATPGRLMDHLENTKGFSLRSLKYLVLDEADRMMDQDFGPILDKILKVLPKERHTYLFSATITTKIDKLQRASLRNPQKVEVTNKFKRAAGLIQNYLLTPLAHKDTYLLSLVRELSSSSMIIFSRTVVDSERLSIMLRLLGSPAIALHGQMSQSSRLASLNKFKTGGKKILVATDVASRGLDISLVDLVINYDMPTNSKDYQHRVGRTARAGRSGRAITLVTQYDVEILQRIEAHMKEKMSAYPVDREAVLQMADTVAQAAREAALEMRDNGTGGAGGKRGRNHGKKGRRDEGGDDDRDRDDDVVQADAPRRKKNKFK